MGLLCPVGSLSGPRAVAASTAHIAVSASKHPGDAVVVLFDAVTRARLRSAGSSGPGGGVGGLDPGVSLAAGTLVLPLGLRLSEDGATIVVADRCHNAVCVFRVADGAFVRHAAVGLQGPYDVEECPGGWLVACISSHTVEFVPGRPGGPGPGGFGTLGRHGPGDGEFDCPTALALVPGVGLVVRQHGHGLGLFSVFEEA